MADILLMRVTPPNLIRFRYQTDRIFYSISNMNEYTAQRLRPPVSINSKFGLIDEGRFVYVYGIRKEVS